MSRGIIWMVWGSNERVGAVLPRSRASAAKWHPELPQCVLRMPEGSDLRCKSRMCELSPYDETLYLDADTIVLGKLDFGFDKARRHGIAISVCVSPWARRFAGLRKRGDIVEYDTGVVFFDKHHSARVFDSWKAANGIDSESYFHAADGVARMPVNDQCGFAHAVDDCAFNPFVLPLNWNLHPRWQKTLFGPLKVWHDYGNPPPAIDQWNEQQGAEDAVNVCGEISV
jgi:hypothetical protein